MCNDDALPSIFRISSLAPAAIRISSIWHEFTKHRHVSPLSSRAITWTSVDIYIIYTQTCGPFVTSNDPWGSNPSGECNWHLSLMNIYIHSYNNNNPVLLFLSRYVYIYVYICMFMFMYMYVYIGPSPEVYAVCKRISNPNITLI